MIARSISLRLALVALALALLLPPSAGADRPQVVAVGMTVSDLDRSVEFFTRVLDFEAIREDELTGEPFEQLQGVFGLRVRRAELALGGERVVLTEYLTPRGRPVPPDSRSNDLWFQHIAIVVSDIDAAYRRLRQHDVRHVSTGPQTLPDWNPNAGGIRAFYFQDPDGHNLELIWFPRGKGDPRWQAPTERLFLGIDHTAIVVSDTEASLRFYRDALGLEVVGESENHGTEQEHLNLIFGARLRITGLRGTSGPGVEFLEYLAPGGGRPAPADLAANDVVHWETVLAFPTLDGLASHLRAARSRFVSSGVVTLPDGGPGYRRAALVRDPDGHALLLTER